MPQEIIVANPLELQLDTAPFPEEWVLEGTPRACAKEIARSDDRTMRVIVWSCTRGRFRWQYDVDETVQIVSGAVIVTDHNGHEQRLGVGDTAFFPKGSWSVWEVREDVRKVAVCRDGMPKMIEFGMRAWHWSARRANALLSRGNGNSSRADPFAAAPQPEQNPLQSL